MQDVAGVPTVDVVRAEGEWYAVDVDPCPSFAGTGLEGALVDSIECALGDVVG